MKSLTRRDALRASAFLLAALTAACATSPETTPAQVVADLTGAVGTLRRIAPLVFAADPRAVSAAEQQRILGDLTSAKDALGGLNTAVPAQAGASEADRIDGWINLAMDDLAFVTPAAATAIPALAPFVMPIQALDAILPEIEAFVNRYLPTSMTKAAGRRDAGRRAKALGPARYTPDEARATLNIPIVHP